MTAAVSATGLGKQYRLRARRPSDSLRDAVARRLRIRRSGGPAKSEVDSPATIWALRDVSFEVVPGEVLGIVGRNGAGKSTLLRILSRITDPTTGSAVVHGRVGAILDVGTGFHPDLTGRDNIHLSAALLGLDRRTVRDRLDAIVDFAGVAPFLDTPIKKYSTGMQARLAFAVAAHLEPDVLLVDEVLAVGDAEFQRKCLGRMQRAGEMGRTVLFVSHNLSAVRTLCHRAIRLDRGCVVAEGPAADIVDQYIADVGETLFDRSWTSPDCPGTEAVRLARVAARTLDGAALDSVTTDTAFRIDIDHVVIQEGARIGLTVYLMDAEERCVLTTLNNREPDWYGRPMPAGAYRTTCVVPAGLLNNGTFSVWLNIFGSHFSGNVLVRDALRLDVADGAALRGDYFGPFLGVVRPALTWTTRPLEASLER